jgi:hypothetical protein
MKIHAQLVALACVLGAVACQNDYLTGGQLSTTPNSPTKATDAQYFVGVEANVFYQYSGELPRIAATYAQQYTGVNGQYRLVNQYDLSETDLGGDEEAFAGPGGLSDVRLLEASAAQSHDSIFVGMAQIQEALLIGMATDAWGDLTYSHALTRESNPPLDKQLVVFDSLQELLSRAIVNLSATGPTNAGPGSADVSPYQGDPAKWIKLAHSLKARDYMHTAEVNGESAYQSALTEAQQGILDPADDYVAVFSGSVDQNPNYQYFVNGPYVGYVVPGRVLDTLLESRGDARRTRYFAIDAGTDSAVTPSDAMLAPDAPIPIATARETRLTWAEAAYRTNDEGTALTQLMIERNLAGFPATNEPTGLSGQALLKEVLTEEYINDFLLGVESWKLYRRTCFPNVTSQSLVGQPMPGRLYYDANERLTNINIPAPGTDPNGLRNQDDPANATSDIASAGACKAGA